MNIRGLFYPYSLLKTCLSAGSVGIGTTTPSEKLTVAGNIQVSGGDRKICLGDVTKVNEGIYFNTISDQNYYIGRNATAWGSGQPIIAGSHYGWLFRTYYSDRLIIGYDGNIGIGTTSPIAKLDVNSDILRLRTAKTPASASATGNQGDICWDSDYIYICVATNTWKRVAIGTW